MSIKAAIKKSSSKFGPTTFIQEPLFSKTVLFLKHKKKTSEPVSEVGVLLVHNLESFVFQVGLEELRGPLRGIDQERTQRGLQNRIAIEITIEIVLEISIEKGNENIL